MIYQLYYAPRKLSWRFIQSINHWPLKKIYPQLSEGLRKLFSILLMAGVTMTLFCTHGRVSGPSSLLDLEVMAPPRIQCPMSILTSGPETWPWGPVGWRRSSHDRVSRVPACESSPRAKLESDRY